LFNILNSKNGGATRVTQATLKPTWFRVDVSPAETTHPDKKANRFNKIFLSASFQKTLIPSISKF